MTRIVVAGGGIAGLAAAHRLAAGWPGLAVTLVDSASRLGGKIVTERVDGFVIEGGPDSFLSTKPRGLGLCRELGLESRLEGTDAARRRTYVMRGGRLYELPEGLTGLIPSRFGPIARSRLISPLGKLRLALDAAIPARRTNGDESLAAFVERRLGREVYQRLVEPLMGGIYAGDGQALSLLATFPQLRQAELEHGSLVRGMLAARRRPAARSPDGRDWPAFVTTASGLAEIVEALEARLRRAGVELRLGQGVVGVEAARPGYSLRLENGDSVQAEAVILATPAFITADLISNLDSELAETLRAIPYVSTATISVAYPLADIPRPLDGYGYIIPRAEGRAVLACTWTSTKFPHRAPEGYGLIRAFVGRAGQAEALERSDAELLALVRDELRRTLGITAAPRLHRVFRWPNAMPQYTLGHLDRLAAIDRRLAAWPGVFFAGNSYRGVGLPDCIASGESAAAQAAALLAEKGLNPQR